jgi:DNA-binding transcriptional MerR regulator
MPSAIVHAAIDTPDARNRERFSISDLAEEFGVTARALRFYEDEGLIAPERRGLARIYSRRDRARLAWILRAKRVGFSLAEMRELIDLYELDDADGAARRRATLGKYRGRIESLRRQRADVDAAIEELETFVTLVEAMNAGR